MEEELKSLEESTHNSCLIDEGASNLPHHTPQISISFFFNIEPFFGRFQHGTIERPKWNRLPSILPLPFPFSPFPHRTMVCSRMNRSGAIGTDWVILRRIINVSTRRIIDYPPWRMINNWTRKSRRMVYPLLIYHFPSQSIFCQCDRHLMSYSSLVPLTARIRYGISTDYGTHSWVLAGILEGEGGSGTRGRGIEWDCHWDWEGSATRDAPRSEKWEDQRSIWRREGESTWLPWFSLVDGVNFSLWISVLNESIEWLRRRETRWRCI